MCALIVAYIFKYISQTLTSVISFMHLRESSKAGNNTNNRLILKIIMKGNQFRFYILTKIYLILYLITLKIYLQLHLHKKWLVLFILVNCLNCT